MHFALRSYAEHTKVNTSTIAVSFHFSIGTKHRIIGNFLFFKIIIHTNHYSFNISTPKCFSPLIMLVKFLSFFFLATLTVAEMPSYFTICGKKNPNLDGCVLETTNAVREHLKVGIPEIGIPPLDPFHLENFALFDTDTLKTSARNITVTGIGDFLVKSIHVDLKEQFFHSVTYFKKFDINAEYDMSANLLVPITGHGPIHIVAEGIVAEQIMKWKIIKKNGKDHMIFTTATTKITIEDYSITFKPVKGMDNTLVTAISTALDGARKEISATIIPNLEKLIADLVRTVANRLTGQIPYDELFPDRE